MQTPDYTPRSEIIDRYAQVLVNYALHGGAGVKPGEVVECSVPDVAKPLALALQNVVLDAGAYPLIRLIPTEFEAAYFQHANKSQRTFFPQSYYRSKTKLLDHVISIIADPNPEELINTPPEHVLEALNARRAYRQWLFDKEYAGKFTWTAALWGVPAKAKIVGLSLEAYWDQIIAACFLDDSDPVRRWRETAAQQDEIRSTLNSMSISAVHVEGEDVSLHIPIGEDRVWAGGSGRNIPSFEIFTSPDWRGVTGWVRFNQPLYRFGTIVDGIELHFSNGRVSSAHAAVGHNTLAMMLKTKNADKLGEFSLTDARFSRITHTMAETLYDENIGGKFGNMHVAIGMAYKDCYRGDPQTLTKKELRVRGFNESAEHTDMVSTTDRTVTATHPGGKKVIYTNGQFTI